ncbi:MAG: hypothetical protein QOF02_1686 [Blastocatellia bacterium]|nr:hypothetical protein [Blastocatellia bacterium]
MNNLSRFRRLLRNFSPKQIKVASIITAALITVFCSATAYYYFTTPPNAIIVTTSEFPPGLSTNFTLNSLTDYVVAHLQEMVVVADSSDVKNMAQQEGLGPRLVKQNLIPIRASTNSPSPIFNLKWKGVDLNLCRALGTSLRAKGFLELGVIGVPQGGWRLTALLKEWPNFKFSGTAPREGGACSDFEKCADDLTEQILRSLDNRRLLNFYIKQNTEEANHRILDLYQTTIPKDSLQADDLVAWGNAFYGLGQLGEAMEKYQEALEKDSNSCSAHVARAFVYYRRPHGTQTQLLADLRLAEQDFRTGIACDPRNEFTRASLCHTLLQEWRLESKNSKTPNDRLLVEAKEHCEKALEVNPQFVIAAVNLGYVLYRQGKHEGALRHFENLSQRYPTNSALFLNYGFLLYLEYLRDNDVETLKQATAQTLQSWKLDQNNDAAANNLGYFYYEQGDYAQAVDFWKKTNALNTSDPDGIAGLALASYKLGDPKTAVILLSRAIQIEPHYGDPTYLKLNSSWSDRAASDLTKLIRLLRR